MPDRLLSSVGIGFGVDEDGELCACGGISTVEEDGAVVPGLEVVVSIAGVGIAVFDSDALEPTDARREKREGCAGRIGS